MPEGHVLQIFLGICEGLKAFHEAQPEPLAHRDLKTANICMSDSMEPIIVDLGSATEARVQICGQPDAQRLQELAEERCSIVYRAPELFAVQSYCMIDERTDIWVNHFYWPCIDLIKYMVYRVSAVSCMRSASSSVLMIRYTKRETASRWPCSVETLISRTIHPTRRCV